MLLCNGGEVVTITWLRQGNLSSPVFDSLVVAPVFDSLVVDLLASSIFLLFLDTSVTTAVVVASIGVGVLMLLRSFAWSLLGLHVGTLVDAVLAEGAGGWFGCWVPSSSLLSPNACHHGGLGASS